MDLVKKAMEFGRSAHASQTYDHFPYFKHLENVAEVLTRFGYVEPLYQVCSFLHDCLEDTATSYSDLKKEFGEEVAEVVYCMTDEMGRNRKEKKEKTLPKIRSNPDSIIVKVADRISNIEHTLKNKPTNDFLGMYKKEHKAFRWALYVPGHCDPMWAYLDGLLKTG